MVNYRSNTLNPFYLFITWDSNDDLLINRCFPTTRLIGPEFLKVRYGCDLVLMGYENPNDEFELIRETPEAWTAFQLTFRSLTKNKDSSYIFHFSDPSDGLFFRLLWKDV